MMRFMSSFKVFSMSSSMDWSGGITVGDLIVRIKKKKKSAFGSKVWCEQEPCRDLQEASCLRFAVDLPNPYSMGWKTPECKSTKMCKHSERPQGSRIGITSVGSAVSMKAETNAQTRKKKPRSQSLRRSRFPATLCLKLSDI